MQIELGPAQEPFCEPESRPAPQIVVESQEKPLAEELALYRLPPPDRLLIAQKMRLLTPRKVEIPYIVLVKSPAVRPATVLLQVDRLLVVIHQRNLIR